MFTPIQRIYIIILFLCRISFPILKIQFILVKFEPLLMINRNILDIYKASNHKCIITYKNVSNEIINYENNEIRKRTRVSFLPQTPPSKSSLESCSPLPGERIKFPRCAALNPLSAR